MTLSDCFSHYILLHCIDYFWYRQLKHQYPHYSHQRPYYRHTSHHTTVTSALILQPHRYSHYATVTTISLTDNPNKYW